MTVEIFMTMLTFCAIFTSLIVESFKKTGWFKSSNLLALVISLLVGVFVCVMTYLKLAIPFDVLNIMYMVGFVIFNWLVATLGYDKVMQAIKQLLGN